MSGQTGGTRVDAFIALVARVQAQYPWRVVLAAALLSALSVPGVLGLGLNTDWAAMLPEDKPSVRDLERVAGRVGGLTTLTLVAQSKDTDALVRFADALVPGLEAMDAPEVRSVDWNMSAYEDFVREHRHLYAETADLIEVRNSLEDRLLYEKSKANPFFVALEEPPEDPEAVIRRLEAKSKKQDAKTAARRGGYYLHENGEVLAIFLRTDIPSGNVPAASALSEKVTAAVKAAAPAQFAPDLRVDFTGELLMAREEYDAIATEVLAATAATVALVLLAIYLLFRRARAVPLLGLSIIAPTLLTFAIAELTVDTLNTSTAFLGSIVIGNGINPGFNWLARYFEERRLQGSVEDAIRRTHHGVWRGTLAAAIAASVAYGSLVVADFRGFHDFGVITFVGMLVCWAGMLIVLPAVTAISERIRPLAAQAAGDEGTLYGRFFWGIVYRAPGRTALAYGALLLASVALIIVAVARDPIEYDFRKLRSVKESTSHASKLNKVVGQIVGKAATGGAIVVLADRAEDAATLEEVLESRREKDEAVAYGKVKSIGDLIPKQQGKKIEILGEIRRLMLDIRAHAGDSLQKRIDANLPAKMIRPIGIGDLPEPVARTFSERDGTRGRMFFVEARPGQSTWDGRNLIAWAGTLRELTLPDGSKPALVGRATVFADMLEVVLEDGPRAVAVSFVLTALLVLLTFKRMRDCLYTLGALLVGITLMTGAMAGAGMKLNFLNFVAFPIAFGNGVDYAVNIMGRYVQERDEFGRSVVAALERAVTETGGAVVLCSLSTVIGYLSLFTSANLALNSFGAAMAISEVSCLLAAMVGIPALLLAKHGKAADITAA